MSDTEIIHYKTQKKLEEQLREIFPYVSSGNNPNLRDIGVDVIARSKNNRQIYFELKLRNPLIKKGLSWVLELQALANSLPNFNDELPPILVFVTTEDIDFTTKNVLTDAGIPSIVLGANTNETRKELQLSLSAFSFDIPELSSSQISTEKPNETIGICYLAVSDKNPVLLKEITNILHQIGLSFITSREFQASDGSALEQIKAAIERCHFVIADISESTENVYFELGVAYASGKQLIIISSNESANSKFAFLLKSFVLLSYSEKDMHFFGVRLKEKLRDLYVYKRSVDTKYAIRDYINRSFSRDELMELVFDYFPQVYDESAGTDPSKEQLASSLIQYCERRELINKLMSIFQAQRPEEYKKFFIKKTNSQKTIFVN
ncbi:MAG TPA: hypothetical protein PLW39_10525 [Thermoflexales bacterium]|nr:hypothetical protein [Thermoflexales bacterium]HQW36510.1 hypothetical protein [Thermoflexales bacterium]HQZ22690.1 hypothetical protein [Thermoflexales bacterium]